ncbi:hypothetical protein NHX12_016666, partial [Muraenolepis orangiensis]
MAQRGVSSRRSRTVEIVPGACGGGDGGRGDDGDGVVGVVEMEESPPIRGGKEGGPGARAKVRVAHTRAYTAMGAMGAGEGRGVDAAGAVGRSTIN